MLLGTSCIDVLISFFETIALSLCIFRIFFSTILCLSPFSVSSQLTFQYTIYCGFIYSLRFVGCCLLLFRMRSRSKITLTHTHNRHTRPTNTDRCNEHDRFFTFPPSFYIAAFLGRLRCTAVCFSLCTKQPPVSFDNERRRFSSYFVSL